MQESGIYKITSLLDGKCYIGSAVDLKHRWACHQYDLRQHRHHSRYMQRAYDKHGVENLTFEIIELVENKNDLLGREQYWLDAHEACLPEKGYNTIREVTLPPMFGRRHKKESLLKISINRRGKASGENHPMYGVRRTGEQHPFFGKRHTEETKMRISEKNKGMFAGENHPMYGKKHTPIALRRIAQSSRGRGLGSRNGNAKLIESDVVEIKQMLKSGKSQRMIAKTFGVCQSTIKSINLGLTWGHISVSACGGG